jgi:hypothetical protein
MWNQKDCHRRCGQDMVNPLPCFDIESGGFTSPPCGPITWNQEGCCHRCDRCAPEGNAGRQAEWPPHPIGFPQYPGDTARARGYHMEPAGVRSPPCTLWQRIRTVDINPMWGDDVDPSCAARRDVVAAAVNVVTALPRYGTKSGGLTSAPCGPSCGAIRWSQGHCRHRCGRFRHRHDALWHQARRVDISPMWLPCGAIRWSQGHCRCRCSHCHATLWHQVGRVDFTSMWGYHVEPGGLFSPLRSMSS